MNYIGSFNPRTRVGCDMDVRGFLFLFVEFQSTHPRGVRPIAGAATSFGYLVSIHAPAWGATTLGGYLRPLSL